VDIFVTNSDDKDAAPGEKDPEQIDEDGLMKEKIKKTGYAVMIRIVCTGTDATQVDAQLSNIVSAFSQFASPAYNKFKPVKRKSLDMLVHFYIFRQFAWWQPGYVLNSEEIATLYHFPQSKYNKQPEIKWQNFKVIKSPINIPKK
jgi:hypothetical protein